MARDIELLGLLRLMRMLGAGIDAQVSELHATQRSARQHALDRLLDDALRELAFHDLLGGALLDAADIAGVVMVDFLLALAAGEHGLGGIDDDDVVAVVDMRGVGRLVLAAQVQRHDRGETADDEPGGVDGHPFLLDVGGLGRIGLHDEFLEERKARKGRADVGGSLAERGHAVNAVVRIFTSIKSICYIKGISAPLANCRCLGSNKSR